MIAPAAWAAAVIGTSSAAVIGWIVAFRSANRARRDRVALRLALAREAAFVEAARRLAEAARTSIVAVRVEMDRAVRAIGPGIDAVLFFEEVDAALHCVAAYGARTAYFDGICVALDDESSLLVLALRAGHRRTVCDAPEARALHPGDAFAAAIPLVLDAGRRCVLYVSGADGSEAVADRIVSLVDQATPAYRMAREREEDRARAEYDGLTGLLTARAFRAEFTRLVDATRARPLGRLGLLFVDTDRFKQWNDTYGHASGDALLRELALVLRGAATEPGDLVARNGGDEFCVVFAGAEKSNAIERARRLCSSIAEREFRSLHARTPGAAEVRISASIGVACFPVDAQSPETLLEQADQAMYHSKKTGRNGVSFFALDRQIVRADGQADERIAERRQE